MNGRGAKDKGRRGEKELAALLSAYGFKAMRDGKQFFLPDGTRYHQDIKHNIRGFHIECKRRERPEPMKWLQQAERERQPDETGVVFTRRNREKWIVIMDAEEFLEKFLVPQQKEENGKR